MNDPFKNFLFFVKELQLREKRQRDLPSAGALHQVATQSWAYMKAGAARWSPTWGKHLGHLLVFQAQYQGAGRQVEQPAPKPVTIWTASVVGPGLTHFELCWPTPVTL